MANTKEKAKENVNILRKNYLISVIIFTIIGALVTLLFRNSLGIKSFFLTTFIIFILFISLIAIILFKLDIYKSLMFQITIFSSVYIGIISGLVSEIMINELSLSNEVLIYIFSFTFLYACSIFLGLKVLNLSNISFLK